MEAAVEGLYQWQSERSTHENVLWCSRIFIAFMTGFRPNGAAVSGVCIVAIFILQVRPHFFFASSSSDLAFARFSRTPTRRASLLASLSFLYAFSVASASATLTSLTVLSFLMGRALSSLVNMPAPKPFGDEPLAAFTASADASPFFSLPLRRGKRISREWYSLRRATLAVSDSSEMF